MYKKAEKLLKLCVDISEKPELYFDFSKLRSATKLSDDELTQTLLYLHSKELILIGPSFLYIAVTLDGSLYFEEKRSTKISTFSRDLQNSFIFPSITAIIGAIIGSLTTYLLMK